MDEIGRAEDMRRVVGDGVGGGVIGREALVIPVGAAGRPRSGRD